MMDKATSHYFLGRNQYTEDKMARHDEVIRHRTKLEHQLEHLAILLISLSTFCLNDNNKGRPVE